MKSRAIGMITSRQLLSIKYKESSKERSVEAIRLGHYERRAVWLCLINTTVGAANIF
jgi:hypothetical protein